jgi:hypothetical protein
MAADNFESPVDLADPPATAKAAPLRWTATSLAVASLFLLATNSIALKSWIDEQTPGPLQSRAATLAGQWHGKMTMFGLAAPRAALNKLWLRAEAPDQR